MEMLKGESAAPCGVVAELGYIVQNDQFRALGVRPRGWFQAGQIAEIFESGAQGGDDILEAIVVRSDPGKPSDEIEGSHVRGGEAWALKDCTSGIYFPWSSLTPQVKMHKKGVLEVLVRGLLQGGKIPGLLPPDRGRNNESQIRLWHRSSLEGSLRVFAKCALCRGA